MSVPIVVLIVLDGWGIAPASVGNAIALANTPNMDRLWASFPHATLPASAETVGLPKGEVGNTETGHLNLGAGRIVYQDLLRINMSLADGTFIKNKVFLDAVDHAKNNSSNLHIMGLISGGMVHSSMNHLFGLLSLCKEQKFDRVFLHLFTDGRDSPPNASEYYLSLVEEAVKQQGVGKIASIMGRYWAMDRDFRWDRTEKAYRAVTQGIAKYAESAREAIESSYENKVTDEFVNPAVITKDGKPIGLIKENDSVIFYNFRIDRSRQLAAAFILDNLDGVLREGWGFDPYGDSSQKKHQTKPLLPGSFDREAKISNLFFATMTEYNQSFASNASVAFPSVSVKMPLGAVLADKGIRQLRMAETEKERFVTYYFNGQQELSFPGEDRLIIPSPKVPTYDQKPQMSAREVTDAFLERIGTDNSASYSFVLINFANADMVGHTGNLQAAKFACEVVDECIGKIVQRVSVLGGVVLITADHGNAEQLITSTGEMGTEHTSNPVPFIAAGNMFLGKSQNLQMGILADVAPTVLKLLDIPKPTEMTGRSLL